MNASLHFSGIMPESHCQVMWELSNFSCIRNCQTSPAWPHHFTFSPATCECAGLPTFSPPSGVVAIFYVSNSTYHCSFLCISLMTRDCEHLFIYLVAICRSSSVNLLVSFVHFHWMLLLLTFDRSLYVPDTNSLSDIRLTIIFCIISQTVACLLSF